MKILLFLFLNLISSRIYAITNVYNSSSCSGELIGMFYNDKNPDCAIENCVSINSLGYYTYCSNEPPCMDEKGFYSLDLFENNFCSNNTKKSGVFYKTKYLKPCNFLYPDQYFQFSRTTNSMFIYKSFYDHLCVYIDNLLIGDVQCTSHNNVTYSINNGVNLININYFFTTNILLILLLIL
jgi:hypothetical protein